MGKKATSSVGRDYDWIEQRLITFLQWLDDEVQAGRLRYMTEDERRAERAWS